MKSPVAMLFDLDGTLLDTAPDMVGALNRLRVEERRPALAFDNVRAHVSHGAARLVKVGFPEADEVEFERLRRRFLDLYAANLADDTALFTGFDGVLQALEDVGMPWGVVTNKPAWLTDPLMQRLGLDARAACIVSGDTVSERKPHPMPLLHAASLLSVAPGSCLYLGDAERDIQAGRAAGMATVAAAYGYLGDDDDPVSWGPDAIIRQPHELLGWISRTGAA